MDDDVKNLFQKFGQTSDAYHEIKRDADSELAKQRWPLLRDVHLHAGPSPVRAHPQEEQAPEPGKLFAPAAGKTVATRVTAVKTVQTPEPAQASRAFPALSPVPAVAAANGNKPAGQIPLKQLLMQQAAQETERQAEQDWQYQEARQAAFQSAHQSALQQAAPAPVAPAFLSNIMAGSQHAHASQINPGNHASQANQAGQAAQTRNSVANSLFPARAPTAQAVPPAAPAAVAAAPTVAESLFKTGQPARRQAPLNMQAAVPDAVPAPASVHSSAHSSVFIHSIPAGHAMPHNLSGRSEDSNRVNSATSAANASHMAAGTKDQPVSALFGRLAAKQEEAKPEQPATNSFFKKIFKS